MLDMKIEKLLVHPNQFLAEPVQEPSRPRLKSRRSITRLHSLRQEALSGPVKPVLSPVTLALPRVPPLIELCLRLLLAPSETTPSHTVIAEYYGLPLSEQWSIPPNVRHTLMDAIPGILRPRKRFSLDTPTREDPRAPGSTATETCPHPGHKGRVFVKHASERFSWVRRIAGVDVGGTVPVRWRGCLQTCLDFLDEEAGGGEGVDRRGGAGRRAVVPARTEESDVDVALAVRAVDLGSMRLDMDDFDD